MPRDADATRSRILTAAIDEFSARGLAGGRVDRIAAAADANKRAIYDYYGSKEQLFDVAVRQVTDQLIAALPLQRNDLPGYVGSLFDYLLAHPEAQRLLSWRRLERPEAVPQLAAKFVHDLEVGNGRAVDQGVLNLAILSIGLANAWDLAGTDLVRAAGGNPNSKQWIAAHRAAAVDAARRLGGQRRQPRVGM